MPPHIAPHQFVAKRDRVTTTERASARSHFNDLCALLGVPVP